MCPLHEPLRYLVGTALPVPKGMTLTSAPFGTCTLPLFICSSIFALASENCSRVSAGRGTASPSSDTAGWKRSLRSAEASVVGGAGGRMLISKFDDIRHAVVGRLGIAFRCQLHDKKTNRHQNSLPRPFLADRENLGIGNISGSS